MSRIHDLLSGKVADSHEPVKPEPTFAEKIADLTHKEAAKLLADHFDAAWLEAYGAGVPIPETGKKAVDGLLARLKAISP